MRKLPNRERRAWPVILGVALLLGSMVRLAGADTPTQLETALDPDGEAFDINPDTEGNLWISDSGVGEVWQVNPATGAYTVYHGLTSASDARRDTTGSVWWADFFYNKLGRISVSTNTVTTWALPGTGNVLGITFDATGHVWTTDPFASQVYRFNPSTKELCTYTRPDNGASEYIVWAADAVWLGDWNNDRILKLDPSANTFTLWQLASGAHPEGLDVDGSGDLWWADAGWGTLARLEPDTDRLTRYALPAGTSPQMVAVNGRSIWYTESGIGSVGVLNPLAAGGVVSSLDSATASAPASCSNLGPGISSPVTSSTGSAAWVSSIITRTADSGGWTAYQLPPATSPWGIAASDGRMWVIDQGHQKLAWLCYWADLDCGCRVDAGDVADAAGSWSCRLNDQCYDPRIDVNNDAGVDVLDVMAFAAEWSWTCSSP